jgi:hypothetical protein
MLARHFSVLAYHPIVAELAAEVAASRRNRHNQCSGIEMGERLLTYWVNSRGHRLCVIQRVKNSAFVFPNQTKTGCAVAYEASARAQVAFHFLIRLPFVEHGFM